MLVLTDMTNIAACIDRMANRRVVEYSEDSDIMGAIYERYLFFIVRSV